MPCPLPSVIIVAWNTCGLLRGCLQALWAGCSMPGEVVVLDNVYHDSLSCYCARDQGSWRASY